MHVLNSISDKDLFIGMVTKTRLRKLFDEGDVGQAQVTTFYKAVRAFYMQAMQYALDHLPLDDDLLRNATFVNFRSRETVHLSHVEYFVER